MPHVSFFSFFAGVPRVSCLVSFSSCQVFVCKALLEEQAKVQVYDPQVKRSQMFVEFDYTCGVNKDNTPKLEESVRELDYC